MKSKVLSIDEFEKVINNNLNLRLKGLLKSPHKYIIKFGLVELNPGVSQYKLEIVRYKKLNIPTIQKLSHTQILHHVYKEEKTDDIRMKCLSITMGENIKNYRSVLVKSRNDGDYYFKGTALSCTFNFSSEELTAENAKKIAKSIFIVE